MTYLQLVNSVLRRLRENEVDTVSANSYSKLIGEFVNDAKRIVEDAWDWTALRTTEIITTSANQFEYALPTTKNFKVLNVVSNQTKGFIYRTDQSTWSLNNADIQVGEPTVYNTRIFDNDVNTFQLYPVPDGVYTFWVTYVDKTEDFTQDTDKLGVSHQAVIQYATALAARERGETGGTSAQELFAIADSTLADAIAIDASKYPTETIWNAV